MHTKDAWKFNEKRNNDQPANLRAQNVKNMRTELNHEDDPIHKDHFEDHMEPKNDRAHIAEKRGANLHQNVDFFSKGMPPP